MYKLFVWDRNTWNYTTVCKLFVLGRDTWNYTTLSKLFVLDRNTWYHKTIYKQLYKKCKYVFKSLVSTHNITQDSLIFH